MTVKTIGRGQNNDIIVNDAKASRTHLQMVQDDQGNISVVDLGSTNGTFVNGQRITTETRLKAGDELRIGNTQLPWHEYFSRPQQPASQEEADRPSPKPQPPQKSKTNKTVLFIIGGVLLLALIGGGITFCVLNKNKSEKAEKELVKAKEQEKQYLDLERKALAADKAAAEAAAEYEAAQRKAAESKSAADQQRADELARKAEAKRKEAEKYKDEYNVMKAAKEKAEREKAATEQESKQKIAELENRAKEEEKRANTEKSNAQTSALQVELTNQFYEQITKSDKDGKLKEVCQALKIDIKGKSKSDYYGLIVEKFKKASDNPARETIINTIKEVSSKTKKQDNKEAEQPTPEPSASLPPQENNDPEK